MRLSKILAAKGAEVVTTHPGVAVTQALRTLVDYNIGALVVVQEGETVGIVTERDILRFLARPEAPPDETFVRSLMTRSLVTAGPDDSVNEAMHIMTNCRVRHLPVMDDGTLVGIVSIGDVVNTLRQEVEAENRHLKDYISSAGC